MALFSYRVLELTRFMTKESRMWCVVSVWFDMCGKCKMGPVLERATKECHSNWLTSRLVIVRVHILIIVLVILVLALGAVLAHAANNALLDLGPLAADVGWLVVVARTRGRGDRVGEHFKDFFVFFVLPVGTAELEQALSVGDLGLGPAQKLV